MAGAFATMSFTGVTMDSNTATGFGGGGIATGGSLVIKDSVFSNCSAGTAGGALALDFAAARIASSSFISNSVGPSETAYGGAVRVAGERQLEFDNCTFHANVAPSNGGALHTQGTGARLTDSSFTSCISGRSGGAAFFDILSHPTVSTSRFVGNTANGGSGGAMSCSGCLSMAVHTSQFVDNVATRSGGALFLEYVTDAQQSSVGGER